MSTIEKRISDAMDSLDRLMYSNGTMKRWDDTIARISAGWWSEGETK